MPSNGVPAESSRDSRPYVVLCAVWSLAHQASFLLIPLFTPDITDQSCSGWWTVWGLSGYSLQLGSPFLVAAGVYMLIRAHQKRKLASCFQAIPWGLILGVSLVAFTFASIWALPVDRSEWSSLHGWSVVRVLLLGLCDLLLALLVILFLVINRQQRAGT